MRTRVITSSIFLLAIFFVLTISAETKDKKKVILPEAVLRAETVYVIIAPDSGVSVTNPGENREAREAVEEALRKWGYFRVLAYPEGPTPPDLTIVIRKGGTKTTITGADPNDRPGTISSSDLGINIGVGRPSPTHRPGVGTELAPSGDVFEVHATGFVWRYRGKNGLDRPTVPAVQEFRKLIEEARKEQEDRKKKP